MRDRGRSGEEATPRRWRPVGAALAFAAALVIVAPAEAQPPGDASPEAETEGPAEPPAGADAPSEGPATDAREADEPQDEEPASRPSLTPPRLLSAPPVTLPAGAEPLPADAAVELVLTIGADGRVQEAQVLTPLRDDVDALVLEATAGMRFEPAARDGTPIPARVRFRYRLTPPAPPEEPASEEATEDAAEGAEPAGEGAGAAEPGASAEDDPVSDLETDVPSFGVEAVGVQPEPGAAERYTLEGEELTTVPGTFGEPLRVVATLPGVARSPFGLGFFLVRGANFANTGFFVDGFPIPILYHFGAGPAVISSRLVERLDFYPGGYPTAYGRFSAGIVALQTGPPPTDRVRGEFEIDVFRASALAVVPFADGKGSISAAFRRSYYELIVPLFVDGLTINYTDYQVRADYRVDDHVRLSLFFFGDEDILDQRGAFGSGTASANTRTNTRFDFQRVIGSVDIRFGEGGRLTFRGMVGRDRNVFENAAPGSDPLTFDLANVYVGFRADAQVPLAEWTRTLFGFDLLTTIFDVNASAFTPIGLGEYPQPLFTPQASPVDRSLAQALGAFYLDQVFDIGPLQISAAARFEYMRYGDVNRVFPDPRLVVKWQAVPDLLLLKAATGLFHQPPLIFQLVRDGGNPALRPERSWQSSVGAEIGLPERVELQLTGFFTRFFQIVRQVNQVVQTPEGPERQFFVDDGEGRAYGLEVLLRRKIERGFYGWLSYTLARSERVEDGQWEAFFWDQTHTLNLAASYAVGGWRFGARFQVATGRPTPTVVNAAYDADADIYDPTFRDEGRRIPTFHRLDVRIDRDFDLGWVHGSIYVDVQNVYNAPNNEGILYSFDYTQTDRLPGLPILPTLGLRGIFE
ncbi:MAG: hypothetical protein ACFCGT_01800 [Sandaracinaceae bacterium]